MKEPRKGEWISVKDEMPTNMSRCLIWTNICIQPTMSYYFNDWLYMTPSENFWLSGQDHIVVSHWMPLPEPPKEQ